MKVGIISNNPQIYQNKNIAFQQNLQKPLSAVESVKLMIRAEKKTKNPDSKKAINEGLKLLQKHLSSTYEQAVLEINFTKKKPALTKQLKSGDLEKQKDSIFNVLIYQKENPKQINENFSKTINNYINKTVINHIKANKNKDLATFFLAQDNYLNTAIVYNAEKGLAQAPKAEAIRRIKLIEQLGHSESHINELQGYTGNQDGIIEGSYRNDFPEEFNKVAQMADQAIEKLTTNPNF